MRAGGLEMFRGANESRAMSRKDASQAGILDGLSVACELTFRSKIHLVRTHTSDCADRTQENGGNRSV